MSRWLSIRTTHMLMPSSTLFQPKADALAPCYTFSTIPPLYILRGTQRKMADFALEIQWTYLWFSMTMQICTQWQTTQRRTIGYHTPPHPNPSSSGYIVQWEFELSPRSLIQWLCMYLLFQIFNDPKLISWLTTKSFFQTFQNVNMME